jgi:hypothetical protein
MSMIQRPSRYCSPQDERPTPQRRRSGIADSKRHLLASAKEGALLLLELLISQDALVV